MTDLRLIASDGGDAILEEAAVQGFAESLRGGCCARATTVMTRRGRSGTA